MPDEIQQAIPKESHFAAKIIKVVFIRKDYIAE
jgi:hypothetical protein